MAGVTYKPPPRAEDLLGALLPGASLSFYATGTLNRVPVYADPALTRPMPNPMTADIASRFKNFFLDPDTDYRARLESFGVLKWDLDPLTIFPGQAAAIPVDDAGRAMPFAVLTFWKSRTTELAAIYSNSGLSTPLANPLTADATGAFPVIYVDDTKGYRTKLERADGVLVYDLDPQLRADPAPPTTFGTALHASEIPENANGATFTAPAAWAFGAGNFTAECWFRRWADPGAEQHRVLRARPATGNQSGWELQVRPSGANQSLRLLLRPVTTSFTFDSADFALAINTWGQVAIVVDRGTNLATFYFNGASIGTASIAAVSGAVGFAGAMVILQALSGDVDELRVWNVARTGPQIAAAYATPLADPSAESTLIACWKFDEGAGTATTESKQGTVATFAAGASFIAGPP